MRELGRAVQGVSPRRLARGRVERVLGFRLRQVQSEIARRYKQRFSPGEGSPGVFSALALIEANPGISQAQLAGEIRMDRATVVALLDDLEEQGLARRTRDRNDLRRHSLAITAAGARALARLERAALANEAIIRSSIGPGELETLLQILDRIEAALAPCEGTDV